MEIRGRSLVTGLPQSIVVSVAGAREAVDEVAVQIVEAFHSVFGTYTAGNWSADISEYGITMTGGGAMIQGRPGKLT